MTATEAKAEVFWTAFKALPKEDREAVLARLVQENEILEDMMDLALIEKARRERGVDVPLREYLKRR